MKESWIQASCEEDFINVADLTRDAGSTCKLAWQRVPNGGSCLIQPLDKPFAKELLYNCANAESANVCRHHL
jgi:hypothetical protein